jgi:ATP-dependent helicase/nuclease subunit A
MTHQRLYENFLRRLGIPCQAESLKSLFADAPINDIYSLLRLACYPKDRAAYAVLLRSPLVAVSDHAFAIASLAAARGEEPFEEVLAADMDQDDSAAFLAGRRLWLDIRAMADREPAHRLITHVWYREGYRYVVETDKNASDYRELYDYFFELARKADERGLPLAAFLDEIADLAESQEKVEGLDIPIDRGGGVRLMTIHKSKGLEFPIVFLVDGSNSGNNKKNSEPVYFSRDWGLSINALSPSGAKEASLNWCYEEGKEEQARMDTAELRRLLYVGMTRAEKRLFITASVSVKDADEVERDGEDSPEVTSPDGEDDPSATTGAEPSAQEEPGQTGREENRVRLLLAALLERRTASAANKKKRYLPKSFIEMLSGALAGESVPEVSLRLIDAATWHDVSLASAENRASRQAGAARPTANPFSGSPVSDCPPPPRRRYPASLLHSLVEPSECDSQEEPGAEARPDASTPNEIDQVLLRANLSPADFGTLAHAVIDARLTGKPIPSVSTEVDALASSMADRFMDSELASLALKASWRRTEYGFLSRYELGGKDYVVSGQADLVFEYQDTVYVVDYKTDSLIEPDRHAIQLDAYRRAMETIRGKPAQTWLFYLRSGEAVRIGGL